ncbi:hypothetical protein JTB14_003796 [Gonioctena quinquepunctata]|nr:hypothetical protein JTB14_003796 [Gonioctena quinquepunctata]
MKFESGRETVRSGELIGLVSVTDGNFYNEKQAEWRRASPLHMYPLKQVSILLRGNICIPLFLRMLRCKPTQFIFTHNQWLWGQIHLV